MILKLSDLQRSLDQSLSTTHGQSRIFIIVARYCAQAGQSFPSFRIVCTAIADGAQYGTPSTCPSDQTS